jgi:predicted metalloprotease with PDZ domain
MSVENVPPLKRETILPNSDRGRVATLVAMCSLAGVAVGFGLSTAAMQAASDASRTVVITDVRPASSAELAVASDDTPWLGIRFHTGCQGGAVVDQVYPATPAEAAGVLPGDVVIGYERVPVHTSTDLFHMVRTSAIGERPVIDLVRNGHAVELQPTLAPVPQTLR